MAWIGTSAERLGAYSVASCGRVCKVPCIRVLLPLGLVVDNGSNWSHSS